MNYFKNIAMFKLCKASIILSQNVNQLSVVMHRYHHVSPTNLIHCHVF